MSVSRMKKLTVFAFREDAGRLIRRLMKLRCVEIGMAELGGEGQARLQSTKRLAELDAGLSSIREAIPLLNRYGNGGGGLFGGGLHSYDAETFLRDGSADRAWKTVKELLAVSEELQGLAARDAELQESAASLTPWLELELPLEGNDTRTTRTVMGVFPSATNAEAADVGLDECEAVRAEVSEDRRGCFCTVTYLKPRESEVLSVLAATGFAAVTPGLGAVTAEEAYNAIEKERFDIEQRTEQLEAAAHDLAEAAEQVEILYDLEMTKRREAELKERLATTERCVVLEGWLPVFAEEALGESLQKFECAWEVSEPEGEDEPPVLLANNRFAQSFEWVLGMYSYPKYGRFDPTFIMGIFYFLIFGLMFADVGYGLLLVIACFGGIRLLKPKPGLRCTLTMFGYCGISATVMGLLFGGWFGDLPTAIMQNLLHLPIDSGVGHFFGSGLWFNPLDDPMTFLILSIAMGGIHIVAGMAVKFYVLCKDGNVGEACCTIIPFWVLFGGLVALVFNTTVGGIVAAVGAAGILLLNGYGIKNPFKRLISGLGGWYSLVSYASDLLSYSRILALCLVAAVISKVINMITLLGSTGVVGGIIMVIVLIGGHLLNLAINLLGAFVHTARLQYLEFFGKFYEDGGRPFEPALPSEEYSAEDNDSAYAE